MEDMREETQAEEQQIVQERVQSESRLASLTVLQRPIRELLPTLPPAVALGHHAPVRDALEVMRQKQLSCVLVVEHGQLVGVLTERDVVTKVAARRSMWTTCRCGTSCSRTRSVCIWTMPSCMPYTRCTPMPTGMSPWWTSSGGPPRWCRCRRSLTSSSRRSRKSS
jgi:CBS domain